MSNRDLMTEIVEEGLYANLDHLKNRLLYDAREWAEWKTKHQIEPRMGPLFYPGRVVGTKDYQMEVKRLVEEVNDSNSNKNKDYQFDLVPNAEQIADTWANNLVKTSIKSAVTKLAAVFKRKFNLDVEDVEILSFDIDPNTGDPYGSFRIGDEYYDAQTIFAWGPKNRPHYRFLLNQRKSSSVQGVLRTASRLLVKRASYDLSRLRQDIKEEWAVYALNEVVPTEYLDAWLGSNHNDSRAALRVVRDHDPKKELNKAVIKLFKALQTFPHSEFFVSPSRHDTGDYALLLSGDRPDFLLDEEAYEDQSREKDTSGKFNSRDGWVGLLSTHLQKHGVGRLAASFDSDSGEFAINNRGDWFPPDAS